MNAPTKRDRPRRRVLRAVGLSLAVLFVALALLEGVARLAGEPRGSLRDADDPKALHIQLLVNGWVLRPHRETARDCQHYIDEVLGGAPWPAAEGELTPSVQGFRDTPLATPKPDGQIRILFLGDSSVYGAWICRLDTLAERLEVGLNDRAGGPLPGGGRRVEVINAGIPGYSTYQSLELLRRARRYDIDGVIVYNMVSDLGGPPGIGDDAWFARWAPVLRVLGRSAAIRWANHLVEPLVERSRQEARGAPQDPRKGNRVHLDNYMTNLRRIADMAARDGAWTVFVIPPLFPDIDPAIHDRPPTPGPVETEHQAAVYRASIAAGREMIEGGEHLQNQFHTDQYRAAMALVAWDGGHRLLDGPALLRAAADAGGGRASSRPDSLMIDQCHPAPAGNAAMAKELIPLVAELLWGAPS